MPFCNIFLPDCFFLCKQQEYYERTKEKKAEMDAKKEAIWKEDIAKGVFIPVSMLPPAEPKKGAIPA